MFFIAFRAGANENQIRSDGIPLPNAFSRAQPRRKRFRDKWGYKFIHVSGFGGNDQLGIARVDCFDEIAFDSTVELIEDLIQLIS